VCGKEEGGQKAAGSLKRRKRVWTRSQATLEGSDCGEKTNLSLREVNLSKPLSVE